MWRSCLWTSAWPLTLSSQTSSCPNYFSSPCLPPSVSGSTASWQTGSSYWCWENTHPAPVPSALELLRAVFSPHCSSPCTRVTAHLNCSLNNLEMNTLPPPPPLTIMNSTVTTVVPFRFLGTTISQDLKWDNHMESSVKKAQQRLYFLRQLRKFYLPQELLIQIYSAIIESVLCTSITVWFSSATKSDLRRLWMVVQTAERIIGTTLPALKRAGKITLDPSHAAHSLFEPLPSGRRYRALSTRTTRHRNSFFPQAIHLMNTWQ